MQAMLPLSGYAAAADERSSEERGLKNEGKRKEKEATVDG